MLPAKAAKPAPGRRASAQTGYQQRMVARRLLSEAIGTCIATLVPTAIDIQYYTGAGVEDVSRWLARGFSIAALIYALSEVSGAHVDPAVSIGFALRRAMRPWMAALYVVAQFVGAFVAAALALWAFGRPALVLGASHPGPHISPLFAFAAEIVSTYAVMLVILMTTQQDEIIGKQAAIAVGLTVAVCGFVAGPISGASMNPARTIAPLILAGSYANIWIYACGPVIGAALAVPTQWLLSGSPTPQQRRAAGGAHAVTRFRHRR